MSETMWQPLVEVLKAELPKRIAEKVAIVSPADHLAKAIHCRGQAFEWTRFARKSNPLLGAVHELLNVWAWHLKNLIAAAREGTGMTDSKVEFEFLLPLEVLEAIDGTWEMEERRTRGLVYVMSRLRFICQPVGACWNGKMQSGLSPTDEELKNQLNWNK